MDYRKYRLEKSRPRRRERACITSWPPPNSFTEARRKEIQREKKLRHLEEKARRNKRRKLRIDLEREKRQAEKIRDEAVKWQKEKDYWDEQAAIRAASATRHAENLKVWYTFYDPDNAIYEPWGVFDEERYRLHCKLPDDPAETWEGYYNWEWDIDGLDLAYRYSGVSGLKGDKTSPPWWVRRLRRERGR